ncbi:cysteine-rich repeat secretory protein 38 [Ricinus communis]|uniref:DUF26 domain-containing protein 2, putative n=1 Tax=Ricinus communis TaxID=3988 RepID=B9T5Q2_RICCO|nr:cysteine-rich repeat secretory protein 38 [Ricinus communis]EEF28806.1 DUF26 domain-containing protein 2 precursor, putative [Ricinus communis]|eukprot:XP_002533571.1 cysteine-rich repeat secretory protein 38 [Ricinus communis]
MYFSRISLYLLSTVLLVQSVYGIEPLFHSCSTNENFTANGHYDKSLNKLIGNFNYLAAAKGFALGSLGMNRQDLPYGLTLCRGDITASDCITCVAEASTEIRRRCPYKKEAIIWYDNCLLKYSNKDFFGQIDNKNKVYLLNLRNVSDPVTFNQKTKELLTQLAVDASVTPRMYAAGDLEFGDQGLKKIYGMAQCTRDLSSADCKSCLDRAIGELPSCCDGKEGGRVVGGSCTVRYEIYPFVNV